MVSFSYLSERFRCCIGPIELWEGW